MHCYIQPNSNQPSVGPLSLTEIEANVTAGNFEAATLAWCQGMAYWIRLEDLFPVFFLHSSWAKYNTAPILKEHYASLTQRWVSAAIDQFIFLTICILLFIAAASALIFLQISLFDFILFLGEKMNNLLIDIHILYPLILIILQSLYYVLFWASSKQATPGQRLVGIRLASTTNKKIGFFQACWRMILTLLTPILLLIPYIPFFFTKRRQCFYDLASKIVVIRTRI